MGLKLRESQFKSLHHDCDANGDGKVTLQEFTGAIQVAMKNSEKREAELAARWVCGLEVRRCSRAVGRGEGEEGGGGRGWKGGSESRTRITTPTLAIIAHHSRPPPPGGRRLRPTS